MFHLCKWSKAWKGPLANGPFIWKTLPRASIQILLVQYAKIQITHSNNLHLFAILCVNFCLLYIYCVKRIKYSPWESSSSKVLANQKVGGMRERACLSAINLVCLREDLLDSLYPLLMARVTIVQHHCPAPLEPCSTGTATDLSPCRLYDSNQQPTALITITCYNNMSWSGWLSLNPFSHRGNLLFL